VTTNEIIDALKELGDPAVAERKAKDFGIPVSNALGLYQKDLNILAKEIGKNSALALNLIDTEIYEARLLAAKIFRHQDLTNLMMEEWVQFFDTWEICDSFCMQIFKYSDLSWNKISDWSTSKEEFVKRTAYVIMATYGQGFKNTPNDKYEMCYPLIMRDSNDHRNFVKKAINWAIREIGKRNVDLQDRCITLCYDLLEMNDKTASWIAKDALRELESDKVRIRNYPRHIYG